MASPSTANVINGAEISKSILAGVATRIKSIQESCPAFQPRLAVVQVGELPNAKLYVRLKVDAGKECGIKIKHVHLPADARPDDIIQTIKRLNEDDQVSGILLQYPLGDRISLEDVRPITEAVSPEKDIDGFHSYNLGHYSARASSPLFSPCTSSAVLHILESANVSIAGSNAVVLGRSNITGGPVASMLRNQDATVTQCHSKTKDIAEIVKRADIIVSAIGQPEFVKGSWVKQGAVVIDMGINHTPDPTRKSGHRLVGDVEFERASAVASHITPVPRGVGPVTVSMMMVNTLRSAERMWNKSRERKLEPLSLNILDNKPSDIEIATTHAPKPIVKLAKEIGLSSEETETYGKYRAKVEPSVLERLAHRQDGKYVIVSSITPTLLGEGKTTTTIGLAQALGAELRRPAFACICQPGRSPTFGSKGGSTGGGYSQVIPSHELNPLLTGEIHAVTDANNLLVSTLNSRILDEATQSDEVLFDRLIPMVNGRRTFTLQMLKRLEQLGINRTDPNDLTAEEINRLVRLYIDANTIVPNRMIDANDYFLRKRIIGQNAIEETGYDIAIARECMAVLSSATDSEDMRERLSSMVVATSKRGEPIKVDDLGATDPLIALLKDAIKPNLMQTLQGTPVFVSGPFADIAHDSSSVLADRIALKLAGTEKGETTTDLVGYVLTEAGFGANMGMNKFCNIKCRVSGLKPDAMVIVATSRALKMHGGGPDILPGVPLPETYTKEELVILKEGCKNLVKHIHNARKFGIKIIVAINQFITDTPAELTLIREEALAGGADAAVVSNHWARGGEGGRVLAEAVVTACEGPSTFKYLYDLSLPIEEKMFTLCKEIYGAHGIALSKVATKQIETYARQGYTSLPVCITKSQHNVLHDMKVKGVFNVPIQAVCLSAGAGFLYPLLGDMLRMVALVDDPCYIYPSVYHTAPNVLDSHTHHIASYSSHT
ncbi:hypothetical protein AMATHDRAFT_72848 [Amanita thiersii Skay4041]|uniref:Methenyltetrahydrofolate cyclohydrolase n=1 Tax=Amanita thiersii Skay4041 TaxID=703135 RepID=A0A2A9P031_9AGAR|nr:hypothetical protein AMATHDRAFT_72848 [Amanita thiersii Skay4041]